MYDAIVVGARVAGAPTAMLLARRGYRVLLVDKAAFPSDIMSGHNIHQPGVACLARWGLLDRLKATDTPPMSTLTFDVGPFKLVGSPPPADGFAVAYGPRRTVLDKLLVDAAVEAGVELRERFSVQELTWDGDRLDGICGRVVGGAIVTERARIVIGADGPRSFVARSVQAPTYDARPSRTCSYYSYWSGISAHGAELYPRDRRLAIVMPTNGGLTLVGVQWPVDEFHAVRADVEGSMLQVLDEQMPTLAERVRAGRREERFVGSADNAFFFRRPWGPGWALVGDAGYHKDPITAQGIVDAFRDADLLADALDVGLTGRLPLETALADYERIRNETVRPMYEFTYELAGLEPPSAEMRDLMAALRGNQPDTDRFMGVVPGTVPIADFFAPENVRRILAEDLSSVA